MDLFHRRRRDGMVRSFHKYSYFIWNMLIGDGL